MNSDMRAAAEAARRLAVITRTVGSSLSLDVTLDAVAQAVVDALGFNTAVVNLLGPDDELHVAALVGSDAAHAALTGTSSPRSGWAALLAVAVPWGQLRFLRHDTPLPGAAGDLHFFIPEHHAADDGDTDRWHPEDALFAPLVGADGSLLGVLSVDDPVDGRLPGPVQRAMLEAFAVQASVAIENARAHHDLAQSEQLLRRMFDESPVAKAVFDGDGRFARVNRAYCRFLGRHPDELLGHRVSEFTHPDEQDHTAQLSEEVRRNVRPAITVEKRYLHADGSDRWGRLRLTRLGDGEAVNVLAAIEDITETRAAEQQLRHLALHDALTELPNRTLIFDRIDQALARARRDGTYVAVTVVDIDHFKLVNDTYGHPAGDRLLVRVAQSLRSGLRGADTAGRLGGDEFVVVCEGLSQPGDVAAMAERLRTAVRVPVEADGMTLLPSASLGCTVSGGDTTAGEMVAEADAALYRAKAAGRGGYEIFDEEMRRSSRNQMQLRAELIEAVREEQFRLHYQPIVDLGTGATVGYEALIRWQHPTRGLLAPAQFLPAIVESDLDVPVTQWVLNRAGADIAALARRTRTRPFVSVNLSARQLSRPELVADVEQMIAVTGLSPKRLWLEITEEHLVDRRYRPLLDRLAELGARIVLDDFGTGYSGLTYLQRMPVNVLKIDREFVARVGSDRVSAGITAAVTDLADVLGITVVAEGVETAEQAELLHGMGIALAQGFWFGRPAALEELPAAEPVTPPRPRTDSGGQPPFVTVNDWMTTG